MNKNDISLNMENVTLEEFAEYIKDRIEMEEFESPILGLGKSGIGKTESIENAVTKPLGIGLIEMRLGSYSDTDLTGFPIPDKDEKIGKTVMRFADVAKFPHAGRDPEVGILLLDEFTAAKPSVRAAALQLTDKSRSIGDYNLPKKWLIVILGNGPGDGGYYTGLEYALMGRADCFRIGVSFSAWKRWALKAKVHPTVIAFIEQNGKESMLHRIKDMDEAEYEEKDANPRSWVKLSNHLIKKEARLGGPLSERQVAIYAGGAVGADISPEFSAFYKFQADMINPDDIFSGKALKINLKSIKMESLYISVISLANRMASLLEEYENEISLGKRLPSNVEAQISNVISYVKKLSDERSRDIASTIFPTINDATPLWEEYSVPMEFDDIYPEYLEYGMKNATIVNARADFDRNMSRA